MGKCYKIYKSINKKPNENVFAEAISHRRLLIWQGWHSSPCTWRPRKVNVFMWQAPKSRTSKKGQCSKAPEVRSMLDIGLTAHLWCHAGRHGQIQQVHTPQALTGPTDGEASGVDNQMLSWRLLGQCGCRRRCELSCALTAHASLILTW